LALYELGHFLKASDAYRASLERAPSAHETWNNLGAALQAAHDDEGALESYRQALAIKPDYVQACSNMGTALHKLKRTAEAVDAYRRALSLNPEYAPAYVYLGNCLQEMGHADEAAVAYQKGLKMGASPAQAEFALAALGKSAIPPLAPREYVRELFDQYAGHFDSHLLEKLEYRTPTLLANMLRNVLGATDAGQVDVVDLGCGTGLCAPLLKPFARSLYGVDLSPRMLEQARKLNLYDELACEDIVGFLRRGTKCFGIGMAADVFVYIGDLSPVFAALREALVKDGVVAFSVEAGLTGQDFELQATRRYAHSIVYIRRLAEEHGFVLSLAQECMLRREEGNQVPGYLAVLQRRA
jgi:predicted TPR repeat methyltransferase